MGSINRKELIRKYVKAIREDNAAVFAGAGLSRPSGFVDWKEFLRPLASDIGLNIDKERDLLSVAQFYRNQRGTNTAISQEILNAFSNEAKTNENVKILTRLPIFTYWTTNYDKLIETGIGEANRNPDVKYETEQLTLIAPNRDAIVYKMHGDVEHPSNAVLTKTDYELYSNKRPLFHTVLKADLVSKIFLFIGFSFEDPHIDYILGQIHAFLDGNSREHFCFFRRVQKSDYTDAADYDYYRNRQDMQIENLQKYGIQTVFVDSYDEITEILREIEKAFKRNNVFISGSAAEFTAPWNQKSAEEFAGKLAGALVRNNCRITSGFGLGIGSSVINGALDVIYSEKYSHVDEYLRLRPFPQNIADPTKRSERWKKYREDILEETGVAVFIFGNKKDAADNIVLANGCIQEFEIAKAKGNIIIPVGSTCYAAKKIYDEVKGNISDYPYLEKYIDALGIETDMDKIIEIVTKIINEQDK